MFFHRKEHDGRLRLTEVMQLRRVYLPDPLPPHAARHLEEAKRRCGACISKKLCDELLACRARDGYGVFCPNNHYMQQLRSGSLNFR